MHGKTLIFVAGIALGIVVGFLSPKATEIALAALVLAVVQLSLYLWERSRHVSTYAVSFLTFIFSCAIVIGVVRVQFIEDKETIVCERACTIEGVIATSPEKHDTYQTFAVATDADNTLHVLVGAPLYPSHAIGETILLTGKAAIPDPVYPHGGDRGFDYGSYLRTRDIGSTMFFPAIEMVDTDAHTLPHILGRWKEDMVRRLEMFVSSPASSLSSGMLFGSSSVSKDITDMFRTAGLSHIIVLSGFNIAIVIAFVLFLFAFMPLVIRIALACAFVIMFVLMVGGEISVLRATLMAFIGLLASLVGRQYVARQALMISFLLIIMYEPYALLGDVSLHLSFLATAGIIYLSDLWAGFIQKYISRKTIVELAATTASAYIATLPYIMFMFGNVSAYALLANLIVLPLVPFAMLLSFLVVCASYVSGPAALVFGYADSIIAGAIIQIARFVERLPFSSIPIPTSLFTAAAMYVMILLLAFYAASRAKGGTFQRTASGLITDVIKY